MDNYYSFSNNNYLQSLKLKYSRQHNTNNKNHFTQRHPLREHQKNIFQNKGNHHRNQSLTKMDKNNHSISKPQLQKIPSRAEIGHNGGKINSSNSQFKPIIESITLKNIVEAKLNETSKTKERSLKICQKQNYDQIVRTLDSPIKLINGFNNLNPSSQQIQDRNVQRVGTKDLEGKQITYKTIKDIDNILASIRHTLTQK